MRVAFVVNGSSESAMGHRARAFASRLGDSLDVQIAYRSHSKLHATTRFFLFLLRARPQVTYVMDMAYSGVIAAVCYRALKRNRLMVDTGDAIRELARSMGRGPVGLWLTGALERLSLGAADLVVVRGTRHQEWLGQRGVQSALIPDGVETEQFKARPEPELRKRLGLDDTLTVGLVGSSVWSRRLGFCHGWDLVDAIRLLRDVPVKGVMIGDGSGLPVLRARCVEYGIADRVRFLGRVPYEELPPYLSVIDVCLSTQTNDLPGQVRTTGKLPLYLAAGRYILASRVGEAALVLDDEMLVDYHGVVDPEYPARLAARIREVLADRTRLKRGEAGVAIARERFDYDVLARRLGERVRALGTSAA